MCPLGFFKRKKKEEQEKAKPEEKTLLEQLCGEDSELYEALSRTTLLNPSQALEQGIESYVRQAKEFEERGNPLRARIMYQMAGQIALHEGKTDQVQEFFKKCAETETNPEMKKAYEFYTTKKNLSKAVTTAKEYYAKTSVTMEKKA